MNRFEKIIPVYLGSMKIPLSAIVYMVYSAIVRRLALCNLCSSYIFSFLWPWGRQFIQALVSSTVK